MRYDGRSIIIYNLNEPSSSRAIAVPELIAILSEQQKLTDNREYYVAYYLSPSGTLISLSNNII